MRRHWISRSLASVLALWLALCLAEPVQLHICVMHGGLAMQQMAALRVPVAFLRPPAALRVPPDNPPGTNYFVDMLNADVKRLVGPVSEDLALRSTLAVRIRAPSGLKAAWTTTS